MNIWAAHRDESYTKVLQMSQQWGKVIIAILSWWYLYFLKVSVNQVEPSVTDHEREPVTDYDSEQHSNEVNQLDSEPDSDYYFDDNDSLRIETDEEDFVEEETIVLGNQQNESGKSDTFFYFWKLLRILQTCFINIFFCFSMKKFENLQLKNYKTVPYACYESGLLKVG